MIAAPALLAHARGKALIGDTGYDSDAFPEAIRDRGMKAVIAASLRKTRDTP